MARQSGVIKITGSIDDLCFYKMEGKYYVRMKSSLTGNRVKRDPAFAVTMAYAGLLGKASKIASRVYKAISKEQSVKGLYRKITGEAMRLLKSGISINEVEEQLSGFYVSQPEPEIVYADKSNEREARIAYGAFVLGWIFGGELIKAECAEDKFPFEYSSG